MVLPAPTQKKWYRENQLDWNMTAITKETGRRSAVRSATGIFEGHHEVIPCKLEQLHPAAFLATIH